MRNRVVSVLGIAVFALPLAAGAAGEAHAPPTLTPLVARDVAAACPGTDRYAEALVRGITERDAAAAAPLFDACAKDAKRDYSDARRHTASTAVGAAYLSLGLLRHDPALLRRALDATDELHRNARLSDDEIRRWSIIPDQYDRYHGTLVVRTDCPAGGLDVDAAYINVAAQSGAAWITAPREATSCPPSRPSQYVLSGPRESISAGPFGQQNPSTRRDPAIQPDIGSPIVPGQPQ